MISSEVKTSKSSSVHKLLHLRSFKGSSTLQNLKGLQVQRHPSQALAFSSQRPSSWEQRTDAEHTHRLTRPQHSSSLLPPYRPLWGCRFRLLEVSPGSNSIFIEKKKTEICAWFTSPFICMTSCGEVKSSVTITGCPTLIKSLDAPPQTPPAPSAASPRLNGLPPSS